MIPKKLTDTAPHSTIETWLESKQGHFGLECLQGLLLHMASQCQTGRKMLVCGHLLYHFAPVLADAGFEITCVGTPEQIGRTRKLNDKRLDLHLAPLDHLPFSPREFDLTFLLLAFAPDLSLGPVLREITRVTRNEFVLTNLNKTSFFYKKRKELGPETNDLLWTSWKEIKTQVEKELGNIVLHQRSILHGPPFCWKKSFLTNQLGSVCLPVPVGAIMAVRGSLEPEQAKTPLLDKIKEHNPLKENLPNEPAFFKRQNIHKKEQL